MSYIRFDNGRQSVELRGSERAWMARVCNGLALTAFNPSTFADPSCWTRKIVPPGHHLHASQQYGQDFETWLAVSSHKMIHPATGADLDGFGVILNTALRLGSEEVRFMARLHGQCEIHAYILPVHGRFFANLIDSGLSMGLYRRKMGWEAVADMLRRSDSPGTRGTVVCSYSVTDTFSAEPDDTISKEWPEAERQAVAWEKAVGQLSATLAIEPSDPERPYFFGKGETAMSLRVAAGGS